MIVADARRGLDRKPIGQRLFRPVDDKTPAVLARLDDPLQIIRVRRRIFGDSGLLEGLKQFLEAIVPVRMSIDDVAAQEFRGRIGVGDVVVAYRDDEAWIGKLLPHHVADRQLLFHARLVVCAVKTTICFMASLRSTESISSQASAPPRKRRRSTHTR